MVHCGQSVEREDVLGGFWERFPHGFRNTQSLLFDVLFLPKEAAAILIHGESEPKHDDTPRVAESNLHL